MSILDSSIAPVLIALSVFTVLAGFFRHLLAKVLGFLILEIAFFVLFPGLLVPFAHLITTIRNALGA